MSATEQQLFCNTFLIVSFANENIFFLVKVNFSISHLSKYNIVPQQFLHLKMKKSLLSNTQTELGEAPFYPFVNNIFKSELLSHWKFPSLMENSFRPSAMWHA